MHMTGLDGKHALDSQRHPYLLEPVCIECAAMDLEQAGTATKKSYILLHDQNLCSKHKDLLAGWIVIHYYHHTPQL